MRVVITGGTKGIGWAVAEAFAAEGYDIAICARTKEDLAHRETALLAVYPDIDVYTEVVDMRDKTQVIAFAENLEKTWGTVDVIVNNAGIFLPGEIHKEAEGLLEQLIETNLYSAYHFTRSLLPSMVKNKKGHIFNMCSVASQMAYPNGGSYSISKFALLGFSKGLRVELKDKGIKVTAVLPGATWSNSWEGVDLPYERLMQANDIAIAIVSATKMSPSAVVEDIVVRPQLGDL